MTHPDHEEIVRSLPVPDFPPTDDPDVALDRLRQITEENHA